MAKLSTKKLEARFKKNNQTASLEFIKDFGKFKKGDKVKGLSMGTACDLVYKGVAKGLNATEEAKFVETVKARDNEEKDLHKKTKQGAKED